MPDTAIAEPAVTRSRQSIAAQGRSAPGRVTGKLKVALEAMVWLGMKRDDAAKHAGLQPQSLYVALRRPYVKAHYLAECEVLRLSGRAKRLHRLEKLAEQDENRNAAVAAIKAAEQIGDEQATNPHRFQRVPGVVIVIRERAADPEQIAPRPGVVIEHEAPPEPATI